MSMRELIGYQRGINSGGWFSQCNHSEMHYDEFISESDFEQVFAWGLDHVRIRLTMNYYNTLILN